MAFPFKLIHHPQASKDYLDALSFFQNVDAGLAGIFTQDFQLVLSKLQTGGAISAPCAAGSTIRWIKLRRFSHKAFFEFPEPGTCFVLGVISDKRHPERIRQMLVNRQDP